MAAVDCHSAPWDETGRLVARFHRAGLDHVDLNAHNLLFDADGQRWMIDFDRSTLRIPATGWRKGNLERPRPSLLKLRGHRSIKVGVEELTRLRKGYDAQWARGICWAGTRSKERTGGTEWVSTGRSLGWRYH